MGRRKKNRAIEKIEREKAAKRRAKKKLKRAQKAAKQAS